jgi:hypothetical protein
MNASGTARIRARSVSPLPAAEMESLPNKIGIFCVQIRLRLPLHGDAVAWS